MVGSWLWRVTPSLLACGAATPRKGEVRAYQACLREGALPDRTWYSPAARGGCAEYPPAERTPGLPHLILFIGPVCMCRCERVRVTACVRRRA